MLSIQLNLRFQEMTQPSLAKTHNQDSASEVSTRLGVEVVELENFDDAGLEA